jgi:xanthine/uracil/vitamin C permease (AzgA family)
MENEIFELIPALMIDGIWIGLGVFLTVQALKSMGLLVTESYLQRAPIIIALFFALVWLVGEAYAPALPYINLIVRALVGGLGAGLTYAYVLKPLAEKLGIPITRKELK